MDASSVTRPARGYPTRSEVRQGKSVGFFKGKERGLNEGKQLGISEGINQGIVQTKTVIVKNFLEKKKYTHAEIAAIAEVSVDFVQAIERNQQ